MRNSGFTFAETIVVLLILSVLMLLSVPLFKINRLRCANSIINEIVYCQYKAIMECSPVYYDKAPLHYTSIGTVNMANTYFIDGCEIIVSLGTGRVYERK